MDVCFSFKVFKRIVGSSRRLAVSVDKPDSPQKFNILHSSYPCAPGQAAAVSDKWITLLWGPVLCISAIPCLAYAQTKPGASLLQVIEYKHLLLIDEMQLKK